MRQLPAATISRLATPPSTQGDRRSGSPLSWSGVCRYGAAMDSTCHRARGQRLPNVYRSILIPLAGVLVWACADVGGSKDCGFNDQIVRRWVETPTFPADVSSTALADESAQECAYLAFAWQEFLFVTQPQSAGGPPVFESWISKEGLFFGEAGGLPAADLEKGGGLPANDTLLAASNVSLVDLDGNPLHFSVLLNDREAARIAECELDRKVCYNALVSSPTSPPAPTLPNGSAELKIAWRTSVACNDDIESAACAQRAERFYLTRADVLGTPTWVELVGFHVIQKTPSHPSWIWATFEHIDNVPDCDGLSPDNEGRPWAFYRDREACEREVGTDALNNCTPNAYCAPCPDALAPQSGDDVPALTAAQPCTTVPHEYSAVPGATCDVPPYLGQVCRKLPIDTRLVAPLNEQVAQALATTGARERVWTNYELVGVLRADAQQVEDGSFALANTTMETYLQDLVIPAEAGSPYNTTAHSGCLVCHNLPNSQTPDQPGASVNGPVFDYSFAFYALKSDQARLGDCGAQEPLALCFSDVP